jgi:DHA2 family multidrug resistance protein
MNDAGAASASLRPGVNKWAVAVAVAIGALLEVIDTSIINVALTDVQAALGATLTQVSWVVSSYAAANVIILPLSAWLGTRFGKKRYFVFSMIGFTVASALCGMANSLTMLVIARTLQGLSGGGLLAKAQAFLFETFPREEQAMAQGFFAAIVIAGPVIGPTLGGFITTNFAWRWVFYVNIPVGIAAVFLCLRALPADVDARDSSRIDWLAIALLAIGLGSMQTVLEEGNSEGWFDSPMIATLSIATVFGLALFVWRSLSADNPVVDLRVLRYRSLWAGSLLSIVVGVALYGALFAIPIFAQSVLHLTAQQTGLLLLPSALTSAAMMPIAARVVRKVDPRMMLVVGGLILAFALWQLTRLSPLTGEGDLFVPLIVRAIGTSFMFLPLNLASIGPIPKRDLSKATAFFNLTRQLGGSLGVAVLSTVLDHRSAFHRAVLVGHVSVDDPRTLDRLKLLTAGFQRAGATYQVAHDRALWVLNAAINQQAAVMSFGDTFWITAALVLAFLPLVVLLGKPSGAPSPADAH